MEQGAQQHSMGWNGMSRSSSDEVGRAVGTVKEDKEAVRREEVIWEGMKSNRAREGDRETCETGCIRTWNNADGLKHVTYKGKGKVVPVLN
jgi:hypothetical protein